MSASKLYKRIMRHYCYMQIYEKKEQNMALINFKKIEDEDLFIDFKLGYFRRNWLEILLRNVS